MQPLWQPLMETVCNRLWKRCQVTQDNMQPLWQPLWQPLMETVCNRLWKRCQVTQDNMQPLWQPLMETVCNRLWKRCATAYGNGVQPLMETVLVLPKSLEPLYQQSPARLHS